MADQPPFPPPGQQLAMLFDAEAPAPAMGRRPAAPRNPGPTRSRHGGEGLQFLLDTSLPPEMTRGVTAGMELLTPEAYRPWVNSMDMRDLGNAESQNKIKAMGLLFEAGTFPFSGDPIIIGRSGKVLEGRCQVLAANSRGATFVALVVRGIPDILVHKMGLREMRQNDGRPFPPTPWSEAEDRAAAMRAFIATSGISWDFRWLDYPEAKRLIATVGKGYRGRRSRNASGEMRADATEGLFALTGESVKVSSDGRLLDGEKRCRTVVETGRPIPVLMVHGLDRAAVEGADDLGRRSSLGHRLMAVGDQDSYAIAAAVRVDHMLSSDDARAVVRDSEMGERWLGLPGLKDEVLFAKRVRKFLYQPVMGALYRRFARIDANLASDFVKRIAEYARIEDPAKMPVGAGHAVRRLVEHVRAASIPDPEEGRDDRPSRNGDYARQAAAVIEAWNAFVRNRRNVVFSAWEGPGFPKILSPRPVRPPSGP